MEFHQTCKHIDIYRLNTWTAKGQKFTRATNGPVNSQNFRLCLQNTGDSPYLKVWDSQFVTFTLYMYTDCLDHHDYNLHVHVFWNDILEFKYPLTELLISDTNFEKAVTEIKECWWLLTSKLQRQRYVLCGYNRTHLTAWLCWLLA